MEAWAVGQNGLWLSVGGLSTGTVSGPSRSTHSPNGHRLGPAGAFVGRQGVGPRSVVDSISISARQDRSRHGRAGVWQLFVPFLKRT